ncbi:MAG: hypothetical protein ACI865_002949 [Flavobacteriaceae bacterium]|jgi:hypothetical protein
MNLKRKILDIRTARDKVAFVDYFIADPDKVDALSDYIFKLSEYPYKEYASWILMHICKSDQIDLQYLYPKLVDVLFITKDQTVLRNVTNSINQLQITAYRETAFIELLLGFIKNYENKVAVQVYSIYLLIQFMERHPELIQEVVAIIKLHSNGKTMAYCVAMRKFNEQVLDR